MCKTIFFVFLFSVFCFSQTDIPLPPSHPKALKQGQCNIGDFDGDGSDDIYLAFTEWNGTSTTLTILGIYSFKKNQYILLETFSPSISIGQKPDVIGDFNGDKAIEFIVNNTMYSYSGTLTKKNFNISNQSVSNFK